MKSPKFSVGQKVRVIKAVRRKDLIGQTVFIRKRLGENWKGVTEFCYGLHGFLGDLIWFAPESFLEPIDDEGRQPGSWDECVWKPEKETTN